MRSRPASSLSYAPSWQVWSALLIVYVVWGSTYLAIRVVVETIPPFLAGAVRFGTAGLVLAGLLLLRGGVSRLRVSRRELAASALIGILLLCIGNAMVSVGEITVPSGIAALTIGVVPLIVLLLRFLTGERIPLIALLGVGVGFVGLAILAVPGGLDGSIDGTGMLILVVAASSWAIGSFLSRRVPLPRDPFVSTTYQLFAASITLFAAAAVTGEYTTSFQPSTSSVVALLYLITFGSLVAYTAYTWLLQHAPITRVATYAYVNPVVAVFLGAVILNEKITPAIAVGALLIVASVAFTIWAESGSRRERRAAAVPESAEIAPS
jgi:drug/metabolite transporter (DMT)-like permease